MFTSGLNKLVEMYWTSGVAILNACEREERVAG